MDNSYKIAVASSDGIVVNQHFGRADKFLIFKIENDGKLIENLQKIKDCKYLLVSKIGKGASIQAEQLGITPMELPDMIEESIQKVISFEQIQNLFERN